MIKVKQLIESSPGDEETCDNCKELTKYWSGAYYDEISLSPLIVKNSLESNPKNVKGLYCLFLCPKCSLQVPRFCYICAQPTSYDSLIYVDREILWNKGFMEHAYFGKKYGAAGRYSVCEKCAENLQ